MAARAALYAGPEIKRLAALISAKSARQRRPRLIRHRSENHVHQRDQSMHYSAGHAGYEAVIRHSSWHSPQRLGEEAWSGGGENNAW